MPIAVTEYSQASYLKNFNINIQHGVNGVCLELVQQWITDKFSRNWVPGHTIETYKNSDTLGAIAERHSRRGTFADRHISKADTDGKVRGSSCCHFTGLRTREDVVSHVLTVRGLYSYIAQESGNKHVGHAFAFDTSKSDTVSFFDPNQGEWIFTGDSNNADAIKKWWKSFWDATKKNETGAGKINYKTEFHKGARTLVLHRTPTPIAAWPE